MVKMRTRRILNHKCIPEPLALCSNKLSSITQSVWGCKELWILKILFSSCYLTPWINIFFKKRKGGGIRCRLSTQATCVQRLLDEKISWSKSLSLNEGCWIMQVHWNQWQKTENNWFESKHSAIKFGRIELVGHMVVSEWIWLNCTESSCIFIPLNWSWYKWCLF